MAQISFGPPKGSGAKAYIESVNTSLDFGGRMSLRFTGIIPPAEGSRAILNHLWQSSGIDIFAERQEWRCTWCASPNPIEHRHCDKCGGPRGWIL